jgi:hypothetical protein
MALLPQIREMFYDGIVGDWALIVFVLLIIWVARYNRWSH